MSLIRLTVRNAGRAPVRTGMTVVAVAITLVAFLLLRAMGSGWAERIEQTPNNRIVIRHRGGWADALPLHYVDEIRAIPGVRRAVGVSWPELKLPTDDGVFFESMAVNAKDFIDIHYELSAPVENEEAFVQNRRGVLVSAELARERGWKLGDEVHFLERNGPGKWNLTVSAIVRSTREGFGQRSVWVHWEALNETLPPDQRDLVGLIAAEVENPEECAQVAEAIDIHFDSASEPTFSQSDKALNTAIVGTYGAMLDAMSLISMLLLGVVALLLGNTVSMSTRERTREFGTLRALGFMPRHVAGFVLGEAATLGLAGGSLGLALAYPLVGGPLSRYLEEEMGIPSLHVQSADAALALAVGVGLALAAAGLPALRASRLEVREALSRLA